MPPDDGMEQMLLADAINRIEALEEMITVLKEAVEHLHETEMFLTHALSRILEGLISEREIRDGK